MNARSQLASTVILRLLAATLLPLLIAGLAANVVMRRSLEAQARITNERALMLAVARLSAQLNWHQRTVQVAAAGLLAVSDSVAPNRLLDAITESIPQLESLALQNAAGDVAAIGLHPSARERRQTFVGIAVDDNFGFRSGSRRAGNARWGSVFTSVVSGQSALSVAVSREERRVVGTFQLTQLRQAMAEVNRTFPGELVLLDHAGKPLFSSLSNGVMDGKPLLRAAELERVLAGSQELPRLELNGKLRPASVRVLPNLDWLVVGFHDTTGIQTAIGRLGWSMGGLFVLAAVIAAALSLSLSRKITRPLERLANAANSLANRGPRVELEAQPSIELESLAIAFRQMDSAVRAREELLKELAEALAEGTGISALKRVADAACRFFSADIAVVGKLAADKSELLCLVELDRGERLGINRLKIPGSPLEACLAVDDYVEASDLDVTYPQCDWVKALNVRACLSCAVVGLDKEPIGIVAVFSRGWLVMPPYGQELVGLLRSRAAAELLRLLAEDAQHTAEAGAMRAQQALVQAQKLEAIGTLVGGIAHDFNNLLAAILGFAELAQASHFDGCDPSEDFAELTRAVSRARNIVAQLLAFSRPTAEERYPVDLGRIVRESMRLLRAAIPSAVEFKLEVSRQPIYVLANATHLQQILMNLCTNAAQAMPNGGRLMVRVERHLDSLRQPPEVMLSIGDTGTGMSPEIAEKVFDPFFTTKPVGQGTGLGLSTVHGLVAAHGGRIELFTQLGIGSTFSIYLPETTLDSVVDDSEPESGSPSGEGEHLVIVDDEPSLTQWIERMLRKSGYETTVFNDPLSAWDYIASRTKPVDLVISDVTMPKLSGYQLAQRIRQLEISTKVILISGNVESIPPDAIDSRFAVAILKKPFSTADLLTAIHRVFHRAPREQ